MRCTRAYCRETKLQREHEYYTSKLMDWQKRFQVQLDEVGRKLKEFSGKDRMSEADTYMAELKDIQEKLEFFHDEVNCSHCQCSYSFD